MPHPLAHPPRTTRRDNMIALAIALTIGALACACLAFLAAASMPAQSSATLDDSLMLVFGTLANVALALLTLTMWLLSRDERDALSRLAEVLRQRHGPGPAGDARGGDNAQPSRPPVPWTASPTN